MEWTPTAGEIITGDTGQYEIVEHLDTGGFSEVFRAVEADSGEVVAVKTPNFDSRSANLDHFLDLEIRALRTLDLLGGHENAMTLREHRIVEGADVLVVDFVEGELLEDAETPLDPSLVRDVGVELADVLGTFHRNDLVYRDLKVDNIILGKGRPILIDFNTVRPVSRCPCGSFVPPERASDSTCGACDADLGPFVTLSDGKRGDFKAPEQRDDSLPCGPWVDVYGLGKLLYFLLAGFTPPGADADLSTTSADVPDYLVDVVARATARRPEDRYRDATELGRALVERTPTPEPPQATIVDEATGDRYEVTPGTVVGRPTAWATPDVSLATRPRYASRRHLRVDFGRHQWVLHDHSRNGTEVEYGDEWFRAGSRPGDPTGGDAADRRWLRDGCVVVPVDREIGRRLRFSYRPFG